MGHHIHIGDTPGLGDMHIAAVMVLLFGDTHIAGCNTVEVLMLLLLLHVEDAED